MNTTWGPNKVQIPQFNLLIPSDVAWSIIATIYVSLGPTISAFGIISNVINIVIFVRHGFRDSVNISFITLAFSDMAGLVSTLWYGIGVNPGFVQLLDYSYDPKDLLDITAAWPRAFFSKMSCWITVFITIERCICIMAPLKVKSILTPRRTAFCMLCLYIAGVLVTFPHAYLQAVYLVWKFDVARNRSVLRQAYGPNYLAVDVIGGSINTISILAPFAVLILSTTLIVVELQRKSRWRQSVASSGASSGALPKRERVVFKVICFLAFLLIICYLPHAGNFVTYAIVPDFNLKGRYYLLYGVMWAVSWILEIINSSCTIFIYYFVSTKYRATFNSLKYACFKKCCPHSIDQPKENTTT